MQCCDDQILPSHFLFDSGAPALTSRGFVEDDFAKVADFFDSAVKLAQKIKAETKGFNDYYCN